MILSSRYKEHSFLKICIQNLIFTTKFIIDVNTKWKLNMGNLKVLFSY